MLFKLIVLAMTVFSNDHGIMHACLCVITAYMYCITSPREPTTDQDLTILPHLVICIYLTPVHKDYVLHELHKNREKTQKWWYRNDI